MVEVTVMLKSLNISVIDSCNHRCTMCSIWKNGQQPVLSLEFMREALGRSQPSLSEVIDLSLTGGEPFLRKDIIKLTQAILHFLPKIQILFINTNGSMPKRVVEYAVAVSRMSPKTIISVSLDGGRDVHKRIRGVDSYDKAIETLRLVNGLGLPNVSAMISTTITEPEEATLILHHVQEVADKLKCDYTFRVADISSSYYRNNDFVRGPFSERDISKLEEFISRYKPDDPFLPYVIEHMRTKRNRLMIDSQGTNHCLAGEAFIFVQADGVIRPCIYSLRSMGSLEQGIHPQRPTDLGKHEPCPCCTECTVYPMLLAKGVEHTKI